MMSFFEYLAEEKKEEHQNIIFGFEEPETYLHPSAQEQLYERLEAMTESGYQVIITTHSSVIVAKCHQNHLIHITSKPRSYFVEQNITNFSQIIDDLGISPGNQFIREFEKGKVVVLVEGPDDVRCFHYVSKIYKENGFLKNDFEDLEVVLVPIGGCDSIKHWHALNILNELGKTYYIILDSDKDNHAAISKNEQTLGSLGFVKDFDFWVTSKRAIENYINKKTIERAIPGIALNYDDFTNMKKFCKNHNNAPQLGGRKIAEKYFCDQTFDELKESFKMPDGSDEFKKMFQMIKSKLD